MKKIKILLCALMVTGSAQAITTTNTPPMSLGVDISQPFSIIVDSTGVTQRANMNFGVDYRYFTNDSLNFGLRVGIDAEKQGGSNRQILAAPGVEFQWFQGQTWMPYIRSDIPVVLHGAANRTGFNDSRDVGVDLGGGIAWNLGNQIGLDHLLLRYDFTVGYLFGFASAVNVLSVEFLKIGVDYRF
jgi:hypothetical protein